MSLILTLSKFFKFDWVKRLLQYGSFIDDASAETILENIIKQQHLHQRTINQLKWDKTKKMMMIHIYIYFYIHFIQGGPKVNTPRVVQK